MNKVVSILAMLAAWLVSAATLDVQFNVSTGGNESNGVSRTARRKEAVVFLVDQSYSMTQKATASGRPDATRDEVLREMLKLRLDALAQKKPDSDVYIATFSCDMSPIYGPYKASNFNDIMSKLGVSKGGTLLYDTLAEAVEFGEGLIQKDSEICVRMFVYSDGKNELYHTHWWKVVEEPSFWGGMTTTKKKVAVRYGGSDAAEQFKRDYAGRIANAAEDGRMSLETGCWLGPGKPPEGIENRRKDEYELELSVRDSSLKNPSSTPKQTIIADLILPIPNEYEKDLSRLNAEARLEIDGKTVVCPLSLKPGAAEVNFSLPDGLPKTAFSGLLSVGSLPDAWKQISLSSPNPARLDFAAPGAVSFLTVEPAGDVWVKKGGKVEFSAKADSGAAVSWTIQGTKSKGELTTRVFNDAGNFPIVATAEKEGFISAKTQFTVHVVDAAVSLGMSPKKVTVGEKADFKATTVARAEGYSWWIDGMSVPAKGDTDSGEIFDRSGKHTAKVRAIFGHGIMGEAEMTFDVAAKPNIVIDTPYAGEDFEFGAEVMAMAKVEGDFDRVTWKLSGASENAVTASVDQKARASKPAAFKPVKGGKYSLVAVADGKDGSLTSAPVEFSVKREDVMVRIDEPVSGSAAPIGKDLKMRAAVKGDGIKAVRWIVNTASGEEVFAKTQEVVGGVSACAFSPSEKLGEGATLYVVAVAENDPTVTSKSDVVTSWEAGITVFGKHNGHDAVGVTVDFGEKIALVAECSGVVKPDSVTWYKEKNGKSEELGKGETFIASESVSGADLASVNYYASAVLPDGTKLPSNKIVVFHRCPPLSAVMSIRRAGGTDVRLFGKNDRITCELKDPKGELKDIIWDLGDGRKRNERIFEFDGYGKYGTFAIRASAKCAKCGTAYTFGEEKVTVEKQIPKAAFEIEEKGSYYSYGGKIHVRDCSTGDIEYRRLTVIDSEGCEIASCTNEVSTLDLPKKLGDVTIRLEVAGIGGSDSSIAEKKINVRFGPFVSWMLILAVLLITGFIGYLLTGNSPKKWFVYAWIGDNPNVNGYKTEKDYATIGSFFVDFGTKWNRFLKRARVKANELFPEGGTRGFRNLLESSEIDVIFRKNLEPRFTNDNVFLRGGVNVPATMQPRNYYLWEIKGVRDMKKACARIVIEKGEPGAHDAVVWLLLVVVAIGVLLTVGIKYMAVI